MVSTVPRFSYSGNAPFNESGQLVLRGLIAQHGVLEVCRRLGLPKNVVLMAAAGGDVQARTRYVLDNVLALEVAERP